MPIGNDFKIIAHGKTEFLILNEGDATICLVGRPYDLEHGFTAAGCSRRALCLLIEEGYDAALRYLAYLGGRFACFIAAGDTLHAIPDCHATYAIYSFDLNGSRAFCSHWMLASELAGLSPSPEIAGFMNSPDYNEPGGKYFPALWTPFKGVTCVFPNCHGTYDGRSKTYKHQRFYPFENLPTQSAAAAYPEFARLLTRSVALSSTGQIALSLTTGGDSRTVLAALPKPFPTDAFSFTYGRMGNLDEGSKEDILGANAIAFRVGIPHRIINLLPVDYACDFHQLYTRSFKNGARFPSLARLYYENVPHDCTILISTVAETGTVFYRDRSAPYPTRTALAEKFTKSKAREDPKLLAAFADYISHTEFTESKIANLDWDDLFYWEHRNSKWAAAWYAEVDMTGFAMPPYNSRKLIETMLSVPIEDRINRTLQRRFIEDRGLSVT